MIAQIEEFLKSVLPEVDRLLSGKYYVYVLMRPDGSVFYVGKGTGNRIDDHEREARRGGQSYKCRIIRKIWDTGGQIIKQKVAYFDNEDKAYQLETLLISFFGRENLANVTDGGEGGNGGARIGAGRKAKDWVRVNIRMAPDLRQLTEGMDRSKLIARSLREYFAGRDSQWVFTGSFPEGENEEVTNALQVLLRNGIIQENR